MECLEDRSLLSTLANFDVAGAGSPFVLKQFNNPPAPAVLDGGPTGTGKFLRLTAATPTPPSFNTISFDRTDAGAFDQIFADFDFRMKPGNGRADGFGFALLNTANFGVTGMVGGNGEEPNFPGSLGIGFDIYQNTNLGDIGNANIRPNFSNSISVHYNGAVLSQVDASPVVDLAGGRWIHARVLIRPASGLADVSVILTPCGEQAATVIDRFRVTGLVPYESRVHFGARSGGETADYDLDNINVQFVGLTQSVFSFTASAYATLEGGAPAVVTVTRTGNSQGQVTVQYATSNLSATAGSDYSTTSGTLTFASGETSKFFSVPLLDDASVEGDEAFLVSVSNPTGGAVVGGPSVAAVTIIDDESARSAGHWSGVQCWPLLAVHMSLLPTGKVMFWDRLGGANLWDPGTQTFTTPALPGYDAFCAGHTFMADGRLLVTGGHLDEGDPNFDGVGIVDASTYDPFSNTWTRLPDMNGGRWYPTNTTLANGDVLVISGSTDTNFTKNGLPQVWQVASNTWRDLTNAQAGGPLGVDLYPRMFLAPDGRVFKAGPDKESWFLDTAGGGTWTPGPVSNFAFPRTYGAAVMYEPGKILIVGGGVPQAGSGPAPTNTAEVIDLNAGTPVWRTVAPMAFGRRQLNATLLPDGKVVVTGGSSGPGFSDEANAVLPAEMWDPVAETWTTLPAMQVPRLYHSTALLLPDGRVISNGGGEGAGATTVQNNAEIYSPPYLFKGPRPSITSAPSAARYGQSFFVATPNAASIAKVSLIRLPSVTHAFDQSQRYLSLNFAVGSGGLNVTAPANGNLAPPGHYMLFVLDSNGVPSVARIIQLNDVAQPASLQFSDTISYAVAEDAASATLIVTRTGDLGATVTVNYATSNGTATAGRDFYSSSGTLSFAPAQTSAAFTIAILDDGRPEADETINLTLSGPTGGAVLGSRSTALLSIVDDDQGLTGPQGLVRALYIDFLGRQGSLSELDGWVNRLPQLGQEGVANAISRAPEAYLRLVNSLYLRFLGRPATPDPGSAGWVQTLQGGGTEEQVNAGILASQEFANRANGLIGRPSADDNFVRALYQLLLNRTPSDSEVGGWLAVLPSRGRSGVATGFLNSAEYRGGAVRTFYGDTTLVPLPYQLFFPNLLRRVTSPAPIEVAGWVNSGLDLIRIEVKIAASPEFFNNG